MTSSKKSTKKSSTISLRDFDPENEDFGAEAGSFLARNKKGASLQHGHLGDVSSKGNAVSGLDEKKYSGKAVSRKELYSSEEESSEEFDSEEEEEFDFEEEEEFDSEEEEEFDSENDEEFDSEEEEEEFDSDNLSEECSEFNGEEFKESSGLAARMRELEMAEEKNFELVSRGVDRRENDEKRSQHVRNQMTKFDDYVDVRFKLQPLVNASNRFPEQNQLRKAKRRSAEISETLAGAVDELEGLMQDLLDMSVSELKADGIEIATAENQKSKSRSKLQCYWDEITRIDAALDPFARSSLQKWHNKMALSSDLKAKKTLRMLNQDPYQQVQMAMQDEERLVSRTQIYRDTSKSRIGKLAASVENRRECADIFDDNDFYQVLLKDWTASHGAMSSSAASAMSAMVLPSGGKKQHREGVDPRASKGRKIRYDVHPKLVNYMVPQIEKGAWNDSKIDEFFASLLGQSQ